MGRGGEGGGGWGATRENLGKPVFKDVFMFFYYYYYFVLFIIFLFFMFFKF